MRKISTPLCSSLSPGLSGCDAVSFVAQLQSILGSLLVEAWDAELGRAPATGPVDTWTGQIGGRVLQAPAAIQRPQYTTVSGKFGGHSILRTTKTGTECMTTGVLPTALFAAGSRPYVAIRASQPSVTDGRMWQATKGGSGLGYTGSIGLYHTGSGNVQGQFYPSTTFQAPAATNAVHTVEFYFDASGFFVISVDGGAEFKSSLSGYSLTDDLFTYSMCTIFGTGFYSDTDTAAHVVCSSLPTAGARSSLRAALASRYPA